MKKLIVIFTMLLSACGSSCFAFDEWSKQDIILQGTFLSLMTVDWLQTRTIAKNTTKYYENNPILSRHPSTAKVDIYFATSALLHTGITHILPKEYRPYWQCTFIAVEIGAISYNVAGGIRINF